MALVWRDDAWVELTITDEGRGCDPELLVCGADAEGKHLGLALLRQQVEVLGGDFAVVSVLGQGTTVRAALPARARQR